MAAGVQVVLVLLTLGGLVYLALALLGARSFARWLRGSSLRSRRGESVADSGAGSRLESGDEFAPGVTILKPLKGADAELYDALASHCRQRYAGQFDLVFGVSSPDDPACAVVDRLRLDFPEVAMRLVVCPERLGTSGKVSNLVQMLRSASHEFVIVNDADISVSPGYLTGVMRGFAEERVGMVTAPYIGRAGAGRDGRVRIWSKLEALGIATDFIPAVLTARMLEGGIRFGLGSTLAMRRSALREAGGFEAVLECLADDYELGARIAKAGYRVEICGEVVETTVPAYSFRGFRDHQMRWARTVRDSRKWGYLGLGVTFCVPWAMLACVASGFTLWSFALLSTAALARVSVALTVGVGLLGDRQVLRDLWLLPVRDFLGLGFWVWSFAGDTVVWRGERFRLRGGRLTRLG